MSGHLRECVCYTKGHAHKCALCICDRLRACEQRVRKEERLIKVEEFTRSRVDMAQRVVDAVYDKGYAVGLDAAREAVERVSTLFEPLGPALAAIDALRLNTADCLCPSPNPDCQHPTCPREKK